MPRPIQDYALIGDCHTGALVSSDGSIDWLCLPRFDSASVFGALLGDEEHGRWRLAPADEDATCTRAYDENTMILRTRWTTATGVVEVVDLMPVRDRRADIVRRVIGISGSVRMRQELRIRFGYGEAIPWIRQLDEDGPGIVAIAGPDAIVVRGQHLTAVDHAHESEFVVTDGETADTTLTWYPSHREAPSRFDVDERISATAAWWRDWIRTSTPSVDYEWHVTRSLMLLRALTHEDTGGIVAALTTSLPEEFGGERNWDYRYVWLRDASLTLGALLEHGYRSEAEHWRDWLLRAIAGDPGDVQIMYGVAGERRLDEFELASLPGYDGAAPVRVGNAASGQYQGDVFGEVMLALEHARSAGAEETAFSWPLQRALMGYVEQNWRRPDSGIWEIRGELQHFTHSRVMLWVAFDCAARAVREFGLDGPVERWERLRDEIRDEIEANGFDHERGTYTQHYGSKHVDASLLQLPQVGYLAADDPRMLGTVAAIEDDLLEGGLLYRYRTETGVDGLPSGENPFLACSFWLAEQYAASGRLADAAELMDRLCALANDVGMLSEQYDVAGRRHAGNTPQALSHLALVRAAGAIDRARHASSAATRESMRGAGG
jgi:GH15 family glucan-1,4-alpha-glucosidase